MGQSITVEPKQIDGFYVFTTDRSLTGQDGARFSSPSEAEGDTSFPATLATRLFSSDAAIENVYVASNDVIVGRAGDWDANAVEAAATTIGELFRFYE